MCRRCIGGCSMRAGTREGECCRVWHLPRTELGEPGQGTRREEEARAAARRRELGGRRRPWVQTSGDRRGVAKWAAISALALSEAPGFGRHR